MYILDTDLQTLPATDTIDTYIALPVGRMPLRTEKTQGIALPIVAALVYLQPETGSSEL
jgi:hypothetical protein